MTDDVDIACILALVVHELIDLLLLNNFPSLLFPLSIECLVGHHIFPADPKDFGKADNLNFSELACFTASSTREHLLPKVIMHPNNII
jgi:hypothetical protein